MSLEYMSASPLFQAAMDGQEAAFHGLSPEQLAIRDSEGRPLLQVACRYAASSGPGLALWLLGKGASVHTRDHYGVTPLHETRHVTVIEALLDAGADVLAADEDGELPLHHMLRNGAYYCVESLLAMLPEFTRKAALAHADRHGNCPLHVAAVHGGALLTGVLLSFGADPRTVNRDGKAPWELCTNPEVATILKAAVAAFDLHDAAKAKRDALRPTVPEEWAPAFPMPGDEHRVAAPPPAVRRDQVAARAAQRAKRLLDETPPTSTTSFLLR